MAKGFQKVNKACSLQKQRTSLHHGPDSTWLFSSNAQDTILFWSTAHGWYGRGGTYFVVTCKAVGKNAAASYEGAEWARESGGMGGLLIAQHRKLSIPTRGGQSLRTKFPCKPSYLTGTT